MAVLLLTALCLALAPATGGFAQSAPWDIEGIQLRLEELGYDVGRVDGLMGPKTRAALRDFQADQDLEITGLPDGNTQRALATAKPREPAVATRGEDPPSLDAVPLKPVRVAPLAPLTKGNPQTGFAADLVPVAPPMEAAPLETAAPEIEPAGTLPLETATGDTVSGGAALFRAEESDETKLRERWILWVVGTVVGVSVLLCFAIFGRRSAKRRPAARGRPQPLPTAPNEAIPPMPATTVRRGHVFGVDIPTSGSSGSA